jgi:hypothetical protein
MEKVVDDFNDYLNTNMPAKLDALEVDYADSITLDDIKAYYISEEKSIPEYPAIFILGDNVTPTQQGATWFNGPFAVTIACITIDQSSQTLKRKLYRYLRCDRRTGKSLYRLHYQSRSISEISNIHRYMATMMPFYRIARIMIRVTKTENI